MQKDHWETVRIRKPIYFSISQLTTKLLFDWVNSVGYSMLNLSIPLLSNIRKCWTSNLQHNQELKHSLSDNNSPVIHNNILVFSAKQRGERWCLVTDYFLLLMSWLVWLWCKWIWRYRRVMIHYSYNQPVLWIISIIFAYLKQDESIHTIHCVHFITRIKVVENKTGRVKYILLDH